MSAIAFQIGATSGPLKQKLPAGAKAAPLPIDAHVTKAYSVNPRSAIAVIFEGTGRKNSDSGTGSLASAALSASTSVSAKLQPSEDPTGFDPNSPPRKVRLATRDATVGRDRPRATGRARLMSIVAASRPPPPLVVKNDVHSARQPRSEP